MVGTPITGRRSAPAGRGRLDLDDPSLFLNRELSVLEFQKRVLAQVRDPATPLLERLHQMTGMDQALLMNSGAEAVETALKAARKWGHTVKGIPDGRAHVIACENNFHGRTISIVSFSTDSQYRAGFGPFTPGFTVIPYGDAGALVE